MTAAGGTGPPVSRTDGVPGIEESARLLGAYAWIEGRLFEVLGALAADEPLAPAAVLFDAASQHHAWHSALFSERLPLLPGVEPSALSRSPGRAVSDALDRLAACTDSAGRLAVLARVLLPRLVTGYRRHLARARMWSDAPVIRALRLVLRDEVEAQLDAEALLEAHMAGPAGGVAAMAAVAEVEGLLAGCGPGLLSWASDQVGRGA